ncbi:MAG TPA: exonuclease SbcCD subunit D [Vicinamibacteria bacterium]|nr:exonuclease SbcCD subunit D [Vicinamibacteria bacterium]
MRFLHTADWHVGKTLRGRSRLDEQAAALEQVARVAIEARVDAVLVAGDVFDSPAPPPEAEKLVYDFLARLLAERIACVIIAGNHDHPRKLAALASLLEGLRIHVRPEVRPPDSGGVVALVSRDGSEEARVAVLPFVPERKVVDACLVMGPENQWFDEYARRVEQLLAALTRGLTPATVNLVLGHLLVDGARRGTGERELHLGQIYGVNPQQLPSSVQYIGLGHLHRPQEVLAPARTFYAGSLIELDFGEKEQEKRVLVVEAHPGRPASVDSVPLTAGRRLREVAGTLEELRRKAATLGDAFLRVTVRADAPVPGLAERVKELLPDALEVRVDCPRPVWEAAEDGPGNGRSRVGMDPGRLFAEYFRRKNQAEPPLELRKLFGELYEEAAR